MKIPLQKKVIEYLLWLSSSILLISGMILPMFSFQKFYIFNDTFSLLGGVAYLIEEGEILLFLILFVFSIILPIYKMVISFLLVSEYIKDADHKLRTLKRLAFIGKWSMTDVFVIAVLAATVKLDMIATITVHAGLYVFGAGVLISMLLLHKLLAGYELKAVK